jgi:O-antigen biosynthesis protein WbqP
MYCAGFKRLFDLLLCIVLLPILLLPLGLAAVFVKLSSAGPVIHWSKRVGQHGRQIDVPKFRTMHVDAPQLASHLLQQPSGHITRFGRILRKTSLDELPQIWSIVRGDMSFVGPRPALFNQDDLISMRRDAGIDALRPGLTGLAQINGRDSLSVTEKVAYDLEYLKQISFLFDFRIILKTAYMVVLQRDVLH